MKRYLMIQNSGVAPIEGYTMLGVSLTRDCSIDGTIGQFASGAKQAINLLLRNNIKPVIFCGNLRLEFDTEDQTVSDSQISKSFKSVVCKVSGKNENKNISRKEKLGFTTEFGALDWTDINMALREFVCNAIDKTLRDEGSFEDALKGNRLSVDLVFENQVRAKSDYTRVFVEVTPDVQRFYGELPIRFLHWADPTLLKMKILPKQPGLDKSGAAQIYRQGVFVRKVEEGSDRIIPSLFDYNFGSDFRIDECRNASDYEVKAEAARCLSKSDPQNLARTFKSLIDGENVWESTFESYYLSYRWGQNETQQKEKKNKWSEAWKKATGNAVACRSGTIKSEMIQKKGHAIAVVKSESWMKAFEEIEAVPLPEHFLNEVEQEGRKIIEKNEWAQEALNKVWFILEQKSLTKGKNKPAVACFIDITNAGSQCLGFYQNNTIHLNRSNCEGGITKDLLRTTLEECVHYITESTDCSRDVQEFLTQLCIELAF